jgi:hypothetical protein
MKDVTSFKLPRDQAPNNGIRGADHRLENEEKAMKKQNPSLLKDVGGFTALNQAGKNGNQRMQLHPAIVTCHSVCFNERFH